MVELLIMINLMNILSIKEPVLSLLVLTSTILMSNFTGFIYNSLKFYFFL